MSAVQLMERDSKLRALEASGSEDEYETSSDDGADPWRHRELSAQRHVEASTAHIERLVEAVESLQLAAEAGGRDGDEASVARVASGNLEALVEASSGRVEAMTARIDAVSSELVEIGAATHSAPDGGDAAPW